MDSLFLIKYSLDNMTGFCIWFTDENEKDGLLCDGKNKILCFADKNTALQYLAENNLRLHNDEISQYDFDKLAQWINSDDINVDCVEILNFWNMLTDFAYTVGVKFKGDRQNRITRLIYEKLFFGNNIPASKPKGFTEDYIPDWDLKQINKIKSVMKNGLDIASSSLTLFNSQSTQ